MLNSFHAANLLFSINVHCFVGVKNKQNKPNVRSVLKEIWKDFFDAMNLLYKHGILESTLMTVFNEMSTLELLECLRLELYILIPFVRCRYEGYQVLHVPYNKNLVLPNYINQMYFYWYRPR